MNSRKILDISFRKLAQISLWAMCIMVAVFMLPIIIRGANAFLFTATAEHEKFLRDFLDREIGEKSAKRISDADAAKGRIFSLMQEYEGKSLPDNESALNSKIEEAFKSLQAAEPDFAKAALMKDTAKRNAKFAELCAVSWKGFGESLGNFCANAEKGSALFSSEKFLAKKKAEISGLAKTLSNKISRKDGLSFGAKSALRRAMCEIPNAALDAKISEFSVSNADYASLKSGIQKLLGPADAKQRAAEKLLRNKFGQTRYDMAEKVYNDSVKRIRVQRAAKDGTLSFEILNSKDVFKSGQIAKILGEIDASFDEMMQPHFVFYGGFFTDEPYDSNIFGGIYPMIVGTFYLTLGAMLLAAPLGIIAAIYFSEYAKDTKITALLKMCVGTLAGVPSIVFGLFGLAFLINTLKISDGKSVVAGCATLALLILPTIIQSCFESLKCVPNSYREAAYGLGAGKWRAICTVILPAALPAMLTGIIISMGRAAGETAPIIFTAATSTGVALGLGEIFSQPTPALPWSIYNICSEHEAAEMVQHVQYGMVFALMAIVLSLNFAAIIIRAKLQKKR